MKKRPKRSKKKLGPDVPSTRVQEGPRREQSREVAAKGQQEAVDMSHQQPRSQPNEQLYTSVSNGDRPIGFRPRRQRYGNLNLLQHRSGSPQQVQQHHRSTGTGDRPVAPLLHQQPNPRLEPGDQLLHSQQHQQPHLESPVLPPPPRIRLNFRNRAAFSGQQPSSPSVRGLGVPGPSGTQSHGPNSISRLPAWGLSKQPAIPPHLAPPPRPPGLPPFLPRVARPHEPHPPGSPIPRHSSTASLPLSNLLPISQHLIPTPRPPGLPPFVPSVARPHDPHGTRDLEQRFQGASHALQRGVRESAPRETLERLSVAFWRAHEEVAEEIRQRRRRIRDRVRWLDSQR